MRFNYQFENKLGMMPYKYDFGKIYKITSPHTDSVYVGSTIKSLRQRLQEHESNYRSYLKGKRMKLESFEILKLNDYNIELIENYPCNNRNELVLREGYWMKLIECVNNTIAGRTKKQYHIDNREHHINYSKKYYQINKNTLLEKQKMQTNCECGGHYARNHKARHMRSKKHQKYLELNE